MAEVRASDLRRFQALEGRLEKVQDERKELTAERRELRGAITANARRVRELERDLGTEEKQLAAVLAENEALSKRLEESGADLERLEAASLELRKLADSATGELKAAQRSLTAAEGEVRALSKERDALAESLGVARDQLAEASVDQILPAKDVAALMDSFIGELGSNLSGMAIRDGGIELKVAFAKIGKTAGFVVPSANSSEEIRDNLHEISIRFDRSIDPGG